MPLNVSLASWSFFAAPADTIQKDERRVGLASRQRARCRAGNKTTRFQVGTSEIKLLAVTPGNASKTG
jgi:hypothetical protein